MKKSYNHLYILSTGRCGTTFLHNFFENYYPEIGLTHQKPGSRIINILTNFGYSLNLGDNYFKSLPFDSKVMLPDNTLDPLRSISIYKQIYLSDPNGIKIIHLVRNPKDFVTSFMNWKSSSLKKLILHYLIPFWHPYPISSKINRFHWLIMPRFEKYCWNWHIKNKLFSNLKSKFDYKLIKLEDLTEPRGNTQTMMEILSFLELEPKEIDFTNFSTKRVNNSKKKNFPQYENWSRKEKETFNKICGSLMKNFGYE